MSIRSFTIDRSILSVLVASVLWGTSFPAISYALRSITPGYLLMLRFFLASLIAAVIFPHEFVNVFRKRGLAILGSMNGLAYLLQFIGQQWVPAGQASILVNSYAVIVPFVAYFMLRDPLSTRKLVAAAIGLIGVALVTSQQGQDLEISALEHYGGSAIVFVAGTIWGVYVTASKKMQTAQDSKTSDQETDGIMENSQLTDREVFVASMVYALLISLILVPFESRVTFVDVLNPAVLVPVIYLAVFCSAVPFLLYLGALEKIDVSLSVVMLLLEVVVAFYISVSYLGERVGILQILGSLVVLVAVGIALVEQQQLSSKIE